MGWSLSWAALKGGSLETICSVFGVQPTGQEGQIAESKIAAAQIPTGWCVVVFRRKEIGERYLRELSRNGEVVYCFVEDHVMFSCASCWNNGNELWRVTHDGGEDKVLHLEIKGEPPDVFEGIRKRLFAEQEAEGGESDVDHVYDAPAELAKQLTGFRHDQDIPGMSGDIYQVLEPAKMAFGNVLSRLFKRGSRDK